MIKEVTVFSGWSESLKSAFGRPIFEYQARKLMVAKRKIYWTICQGPIILLASGGGSES